MKPATELALWCACPTKTRLHKPPVHPPPTNDRFLSYTRPDLSFVKSSCFLRTHFFNRTASLLDMDLVDSFFQLFKMFFFFYFPAAAAAWSTLFFAPNDRQFSRRPAFQLQVIFVWTLLLFLPGFTSFMLLLMLSRSLAPILEARGAFLVGTVHVR